MSVRWSVLFRAALGAAVLFAAVAQPLAARRARAFAVCDDPPDNAADLLSITSPVPGPQGFGGPAPVTLTIQIAEGLAIFQTGDLSSTFEWGDGSSSTVDTRPCPDGLDSYWPTQSLSHTYHSPGIYQTTWRFVFGGQPFPLPFVTIVVVDAVTPTPQPPTPTPVPQPTPVSTVPAGATPAPGVATPASSASASPGAAVSASPSPTVTPTSTPSATASAPATTTPGGGSSSGLAAPTIVANQEYRSRTFLPLEEIDEVSREPSVVVTNLVIAGVTVWVLFSSVLLNQVLQNNRAEIDRRTSWLTQPVGRLRRPRRPRSGRGLTGWLERLLIPGAVLGLTGAIYAVLEPEVGLNQHTFILFGSAVLGVGLVTYLCSGLEAAAVRRVVGVEAAVRPFPACIAIAAASVGISRLLDLQPGVMYGFVASCAVAAPVAATSGQTGRVAVTSTAAALGLAVGAWLLVGPIRGLNDDPGGWLPALLEATVIVVFIGGIEGTVIGMLPLAETDGGKLYRWHRWLWLALALAAAFLTWHVLLGRERSYFGGLRQAASLTVFVVFVVYTVLTAALWSYFRFRRSATPEAPLGPVVAP